MAATSPTQEQRVLHLHYLAKILHVVGIGRVDIVDWEESANLLIVEKLGRQ